MLVMALCLALQTGCSTMAPESHVTSAIPSSTNAPDPSQAKADPLPVWQTLLLGPWVLAYGALAGAGSQGYSYSTGIR